MPDDLPTKDTNPDLTTSLTPELLKTMPREKLEQFFNIILKSQVISLDNQKKLTELLRQASTRIQELEGINQTQEAELILLRNRPT